MPVGAVVYLLHYQTKAHHRHFLGLAPAEDAIDVRQVPQGSGLRKSRPGGAEPVLADVWEAATMADARQLHAKLRRQGSRKRLCSICNPGNARGSGTGNWTRKRKRSD